MKAEAARQVKSVFFIIQMRDDDDSLHQGGGHGDCEQWLNPELI